MAERRFTATTPYTFDQLCTNLGKFMIPPFQRAYTWKPKQINELWESLTTSEAGYFIGNLVFLEATQGSEERFQIIDGQQRLFTVSLLLTALRDEYFTVLPKTTTDEDWKCKRISDIDDKMLYFKENKFPFKESLRLLPGKENLLAIYKSIIFHEEEDLLRNSNEHDDNKTQFVRNFKIIKNLVRMYVDTGKKLEKLDELLEKISNLLFIVIVCSSDNDAYEIFEGLNSTGIDLSVSDLVKNAVIQAAKTSASRQSCELKWTEIESLFEATSMPMFSRFLRHQWISEEGYITGNKLFRAIKEKKLKGREGYEIVEYVEDLLQSAKAYIGFRDAIYESFLLTKISVSGLESIKNFRYLDTDQVYEVILAYYKKKLTSSAYENKYFIKDLNNLWAFAFRAKIMSLNPSEYEKIFADHCITIRNYKGQDFKNMSNDFNQELTELVKNDDVFIERFAHELKYTSDVELIGYILSVIMSKYDRDIKISKPTIEHILPKDPTKWNLSKEEIVDYVDDIGNLTLLHETDNSAAGNETIKNKYAKVYINSKFLFNKDLKDWIEKFEKDYKLAIQNRGRSLGEIANDIWTIR